MSQRPQTKSAKKRPPTKPPKNSLVAERRDRWPFILAALIVVLIGGLYLLYRATNQADGSAGTTAKSDYQVGSPGRGKQAPAFTLPATKGGTVSLDQYRGKTVLLYFHEGLGCQPCWDQIRDLDKAKTDLKTAGIDDVVAITTGPVDLIKQKVTDEHLTSVNLADADLAVSRSYEANKYGMMGNDRDGHTFILVGPDGKIGWRADYGGAPKYTMFVPVQRLLADLKAGQQ
ncbi:peroxiredoxin Q/BCP [Kribbella aluminosa]|uniref:Peroxiredoxin Q/BCP n=1 Tax=Kribbella aluminosa TaxID=416017 RepID=A0ABS4UBI0_9ACTN|nr:peroxiredoxin family protein [Kribbella aluminosa]MBP2348980.1 peroxiredoxin Q/BCP [Kribbella aluminosa]